MIRGSTSISALAVAIFAVRHFQWYPSTWRCVNAGRQLLGKHASQNSWSGVFCFSYFSMYLLPYGKSSHRQTVNFYPVAFIFLQITTYRQQWQRFRCLSDQLNSYQSCTLAKILWNKLDFCNYMSFVFFFFCLT